MDFEKSFDELLSGILLDYRNQFPEADLSRGSLLFIKSACLASALWGLYKHQDWVADQVFPDSASSANLERHAYVRGLQRKVGESDADLLSRLLDYIRRPPAGGNRYDYVKWALDVQGVKDAYCIPLAQGPGSVDVVLIADAVTTGSEIPSAQLLAEVKAHIDAVRPVTAQYTRVVPAAFIAQDVTLAGSGAGWDKLGTAQEIAAYLSGFVPDQVLYRSKLANIAINNGADDASVVVPAANVVPAPGSIIRAGVVSVP